MNIFDLELKHVYKFKKDLGLKYALWIGHGGEGPSRTASFLINDDEFMVIEIRPTERTMYAREVKIIGVHKELLGWLCADRSIGFEEVLP